jgi:hypothetical protein
VKEYELFLPLTYNDGTPIEAVKFRILQARLLEFFNGVTFFPQPNQGQWRMAGVTYTDEIVIYRVVAPDVRAARRFFKQLKSELLSTFQQEELLILERDVKRM